MAKRRSRSGPSLEGEGQAVDWAKTADVKDLTSEALEGVVKTPEDVRFEKEIALEQFGFTLAVKRKKWIQAKAASMVENRLTEDMDQYLGQDEAARSEERRVGEE